MTDVPLMSNQKAYEVLAEKSNMSKVSRKESEQWNNELRVWTRETMPGSWRKVDVAFASGNILG